MVDTCLFDNILSLSRAHYLAVYLAFIYIARLTRASLIIKLLCESGYLWLFISFLSAKEGYIIWFIIGSHFNLAYINSHRIIFVIFCNVY